MCIFFYFFAPFWFMIIALKVELVQIRKQEMDKCYDEESKGK